MRLIIPAEVEAKLHAYVRCVTTEIAGMGKAKISQEGDIMLLDVAIYDQVVTGGTADLSSEALAKFQTELIQAGESPKDWIVWWHSHADMAAFFSGRDTDTIDSSSEFQYLVSLVVNRKRERKARFDIYNPFRFVADDLAIIVGTPEEVIPEDIRAEVEEKVHTKVYSWEKERQSYGQHSLGFGKHKVTDLGELGKVYPASNDDDYGVSYGGTRPPSSIITVEEPSSLDEDEIATIIDALKDQITYHEQKGTTDSVECEELRADLADWEYELAMRGANDDTMAKIKEFNEGK